MEVEETDAGTFNMRVADIEDSAAMQTAYYNSVPILPESTGVVGLDATLQLDYFGNGAYETVVASAVLDADASLDFTKPVTHISFTPDVWTREPVEVALSASDGNSGILRTEYSLDSGVTWQRYITPFVVGAEHVAVLYRSIDRAGNIEEAQSQAILIDLTAPEAALMIDSTTRQVFVTGVDASATVVAHPDASIVVITDEAGNSTELQTIVVTSTNLVGYSTLSFQITQVRRNGDNWQTPERNQIFTQWQIDDTGALVWLQEALQVKNEFYIIGRYETATNETTIWQKGSSGLQEEGRVVGIALPTLQTDNLSFIYY